jgi:hypothetical protein
MIVENGAARYQILGEKVADTTAYRVYLCQELGSGRTCLLQISAESTHNGGLDRAAYVLKELRKAADQLEELYATQSNGKKLHYDRLFPVLVDSFTAASQGGRRVNVLAFTDVEAPTQMVPLSNLAEKDRLRVELPSSAWIMGRLLKLLVLVHDENISVGSLSGNNILLDVKQHFAVVFDWSSATTHPSAVPASVRKEDIANAAKAVFGAIGGNPKSGAYICANNDERSYYEFLWNLASRREASAQHAHEQFYELSDRLFGRGFKEFHTLPI